MTNIARVLIKPVMTEKTSRQEINKLPEISKEIIDLSLFPPDNE